jgi:chemotaxis-related protein WspB
MLFLLFQLGTDRYALPVHHVREVLPLVELKKIPQAPPGVAGVFSFHGEPVPVLDLSEYTLGHPALPRMSTRIVLVEYRRHLLGLIAEHATETIRREETDFVDAGVTVGNAPYLGPVATDVSGMVQRVELDRLLPESIRELLFREAGANA